MKIPKTLGACADQLFQLRNKRLQLQHDIDKLAKDESVLREHLIEVLPKSDATGVAGKLCRATVVVPAAFPEDPFPLQPPAEGASNYALARSHRN